MACSTEVQVDDAVAAPIVGWTIAVLPKKPILPAVLAPIFRPVAVPTVQTAPSAIEPATGKHCRLSVIPEMVAELATTVARRMCGVIGYEAATLNAHELVP